MERCLTLKTYVISDTHFNHANIIKYTTRPFKSVDEMNDVLIYNWNQAVGPRDEVIHVGDFAFGSRESAEKIINQLHGYKILVLGNHDRSAKSMQEMGFDEVYTEYRRRVRGQDVLFFHDPELCTQEYDLYVHGHTHSHLVLHPTDLDIRNACVEAIHYKPILLGDLLDVDSGRSSNLVELVTTAR